MGFCRQIDEDTIELKALDRLPDGPIKRHLDSCSSCNERVTRQRMVIEYLRQLLVDRRETGNMRESPNGHGQRSGLDETS